TLSIRAPSRPFRGTGKCLWEQKALSVQQERAFCSQRHFPVAQPFALPVGLFGELESVFGDKKPFPATRKGRFEHKATFQFPEKAYWEREWLGTVKVEDENEATRFSVLRAFSPYVLVVILLVITRTVPAVKSALTGESATLSFPNL